MYFQARGEYNTWFKPDSQQSLDEWKHWKYFLELSGTIGFNLDLN